MTYETTLDVLRQSTPDERKQILSMVARVHGQGYAQQLEADADSGVGKTLFTAAECEALASGSG